MDSSTHLSPQVTVVVPVFNEEPANLRLLLERLASVLGSLLIFYEVVFVDDGSGVNSNVALRQLAREFDYVRVIVLSRNFGETAAICAGLEYSRGDVVINMDSDLQDPPELIPTMLQYWRDGCDVVFTRQSTRKETIGRQFLAAVFYRVLDNVSSVRIPVDAGEFRLLSRRAVDAVCRAPEKAKFLRGLIPWIGFKQVVIPFDRDARVCGQSSYTTDKLIKLAMEGLISFNTQPLYCIPSLGVLLVLIGLVGLVASAIKTQIVLGLELSLISILLFIGGLQISCCGIIAIYLAEVLRDTRGRPAYIVSEEIKSAQILNAVPVAKTQSI